MPDVICVVGPTASGKTRLAVELAKALSGEVVSCDSMQLYRRMDIGTAKPSAEEMQGIAHHMLSVLEPWEECSVGRFTELADRCVQDILSRGKVAILAGGTGLYVDSLVAGRSFAPIPETGRREELERMADERGMPAMLEYLRSFDPEAAARLHPADRKRILRACEVYLETGKTITAHNKESRLQPPRYTPCWLGLDYVNRSDLYARIDRRVDEMLRQGLLEELQALLREPLPPGRTALAAIGYKELLPALEGKCSLEQAVEDLKRESRRYAKRQLTWFRRNSRIHWLMLPADPDFSAVFAEARQHLAAFDAGELVE